MKSKRFIAIVAVLSLSLIGNHLFALPPLAPKGDGTPYFPDVPQFKTMVVKFKDRTTETDKRGNKVVTEGTSTFYVDAASDRFILKMNGKGRKKTEHWDNTMYANKLSYWWNNGSREVRFNGEVWTPIKVWQSSLFLLLNSKMKVVGEENILGRVCKVTEDEDSRYWIYKGIIVKEAHRESNYWEAVYEPVEIEEDVILPKSIFDFPKNHKLKDMHDR